jgi:hypothetical protein
VTAKLRPGASCNRAPWSEGQGVLPTVGVLADRIVAWWPCLMLPLCHCQYPADLNGRGLICSDSSGQDFLHAELGIEISSPLL